MVDHISPERRSWLMSRVRGKHTSPEIRVRRAAHRLGLRFRLHRKDLPGKPDLVFRKHAVALFVHGCFWHRHPNCPKSTTPKSKTQYWEEKFVSNCERDARSYTALAKLGWKVEIVWECETKQHQLLDERLRSIFKT